MMHSGTRHSALGPRSMFLASILVVAIAAPAHAQIGGITRGLQKAKQAKDTIDNLTFSDAEEQQLGVKVSTLLRQKYGVAQDRAAHKYVTLVGSVLAAASSRPKLTWTFVILDTDGVNAFASPGGFIHITRGALALIQNEAELAGVLGHEIAHVTGKHTIEAIRKGNAAKELTSLAGTALLEAVANKAYEAVLENAYDRGDEQESDSVGFKLATGAGYAPGGLGAFLTRLADRNKDLKERSGVFASHPETKDRVDALAKLASSQKTTATVTARYQQNVPFKPVPVTVVAGGVAGASNAAPAKKAETKAEPNTATAPPAKKGGGFGLGGLNPLGREKASDQTVASAGSRGVNPDRDAKGGSNPALVAVVVSAAEIAEFRKGIA
jgi:Zn-dependent protease with chaperone function